MTRWTTPEGAARAARKYEAARPIFEARNALMTNYERVVLTGAMIRAEMARQQQKLRVVKP